MSISKMYQEDIIRKLKEIEEFLGKKYNGLDIDDKLLDMIKFEIDEMLKTYVVGVLHKDNLNYELDITNVSGYIQASIRFE